MDDIIGAVCVADRQRLGLQGNVTEAQWAVCYIKYAKQTRRRTERRCNVHVVLTEEKTKRQKTDLTYAQFPISLAKIFRGTVLGSSLSFPSRIPLKRKKDAGLRMKTRSQSVSPMFRSEGR